MKDSDCYGHRVCRLASLKRQSKSSLRTAPMAKRHFLVLSVKTLPVISRTSEYLETDSEAASDREVVSSQYLFEFGSANS